MKNQFKYLLSIFSGIVLSMFMTTLLHCAVNVNFTISGKLLRKQNLTSTTAGVSRVDAETGTTFSQPSVTTNYDQYEPATFNTVTIKVYSVDSTGSPVYTFAGLSAANISFNSNTGDFSKTVSIAKSRFTYIALVFLDAQLTSNYSVSFNTNDVSNSPPIGSIMPYFGDGSDMTDLEVGGWYLCDGRSINTTTMNQLTQSEVDALKSVLSNAGNPSPNNLPDLRGYFLRGADRGTGNDPSLASRGGSGNKIGSSQTADVGVHNHTGSTSGAGSHNHSYTDYFFAENNGGGTSQGANGHDFDNNPTSNYQGFTSPAGDHTHTVTINNSTGTETRPKNVYVNYIIKCRN